MASALSQAEFKSTKVVTEGTLLGVLCRHAKTLCQVDQPAVYDPMWPNKQLHTGQPTVGCRNLDTDKFCSSGEGQVGLVSNIAVMTNQSNMPTKRHCKSWSCVKPTGYFGLQTLHTKPNLLGHVKFLLWQLGHPSFHAHQQ